MYDGESSSGDEIVLKPEVAVKVAVKPKPKTQQQRQQPPQQQQQQPPAPKDGAPMPPKSKVSVTAVLAEVARKKALAQQKAAAGGGNNNAAAAAAAASSSAPPTAAQGSAPRSHAPVGDAPAFPSAPLDRGYAAPPQQQGGQQPPHPHFQHPHQQHLQHGRGGGGRGGGGSPMSAQSPSAQMMTPGGTTRQAFEPHVSREEAIKGVQEGRYFRGKIAIKKYGSAICFVRSENWDGQDVLIEQKLDRNRAFDGDTVIIEVHPQDKWKDKTGRQSEDQDPLKPPPGGAENPSSLKIRSREEDAALPKEERSKLPDARPICRALKLLNKPKTEDVDPIEDSKQPRPFWLGVKKLVTGKIVHIWKEGHVKKQVCKALGTAKYGNQGNYKSFVRFAPYNEKYPHMECLVKDFANEKIKEDIEGYLVYMEMLPWQVGQNFPRCKMLQVLGNAYQVETETRAILIDHGTDYTDEFSEECLKVIPDEVPIPSEAELLKEGRRDMRLGAKHARFVTSIDPASARDLDDALSCESLGGGHWRVGVHIADVSTFVPFGSDLDEEARKRATSVYMVQRVIPMLPRKLCEQHCSLNTLGDKLAFSVEWTMDGNGKILKEWMGQTVIRNQCKLAYENAQAIIDGTFTPDMVDLEHIPAAKREWTIDRIKESVQGLWGIAQNIRRKRYERGALSLNQGKLWFDFENGNSNMAPKGWHLHVTAEANWLVEEFMVMANARVTEKCIEYCPDVALARYHGNPDPSRFTTLVNALEAKGIRFNTGSGLAMGKSLESLSNHKNDHSLHHFALNLELYTHFTSPIRRYADLVVHRVLKCALEIETLYKQRLRQGETDDEIEIGAADIKSGYLLLPEADVSSIAVHCNERKDEARKAGDKSIEVFYGLYLQSKYNMWKEDGVTDYKETHRGALIKVQEKSFNIFIETLCIDKEFFHNNGQKDQAWIGENKKNSKSGVMCIQWEEGLWQECELLTTWDITVYYKADSKKLEFVARLCPPPRDTLVSIAEAEATCAAVATPSG